MVMHPPDDLSIVYEYAAGTLPPPYHDEYSIQIDTSGTGTLVFRPDYPGPSTPIWTESFPVAAEALADVYRLMLKHEAFGRRWTAVELPPIGGDAAWLKATAAGNRVEVPAYLREEDRAAAKEIYAAIEKLVPQPVWKKVRAQQKRYQSEYKKR